MKFKLDFRNVLSVILILVFLVSSVVVIVKRLEYEKADAEYKEAQSYVLPAVPTPQVTEPASVPEETPPVTSVDKPARESEPDPLDLMLDDPNVEYLRKIDFAGLKSVNEEVIGWILIPDTVINYPVLQTTDNEFYLNHTWEKNYNSNGSVFMEELCSPAFDEFNTILYAHHMKSGAMFGGLQNFGTESYWQEHPTIYIATPDYIYKYDIFAAFEPRITDPTYYVRIKTESLEQKYIDFSVENTQINTGIVPDIESRILTLSTCTGHGYQTRWVVQGCLSGETITRVPLTSSLPEIGENVS